MGPSQHKEQTYWCCSAFSMQYRPSLSISGRETRLSGGAAVLICNGPAALMLTAPVALPALVFIERDWRYCSVLLMPRRICEDTGRLRLLRTAAAPEGGTTNADTPRTGPIPTILLPEFDGCSPEAEPPPRFVLARAAATVSAGILIFSLYSQAESDGAATASSGIQLPELVRNKEQKIGVMLVGGANVAVDVSDA